MKLIQFFFVTLGLWFFCAPVAAKSREQSTVGISLIAVDRNGNPLQTLVAGEYIRLDLSADLSALPSKASASVTASAAFTTTILGRPVGYTVSLPLKGSAGSRIDPTIGASLSGSDLVKPYENTVYHEILDFQIPPETPAGIVTFTVSVSEASIKTVKKKFVFQVRR
jgi:hypothetical protein